MDKLTEIQNEIQQYLKYTKKMDSNSYERLLSQVEGITKNNVIQSLQSQYAKNLAAATGKAAAAAVATAKAEYNEELTQLRAAKEAENRLAAKAAEAKSGAEKAEFERQLAEARKEVAAATRNASEARTELAEAQAAAREAAEQAAANKKAAVAAVAAVEERAKETVNEAIRKYNLELNGLKQARNELERTTSATTKASEDEKRVLRESVSQAQRNVESARARLEKAREAQEIAERVAREAKEAAERIVQQKDAERQFAEERARTAEEAKAAAIESERAIRQQLEEAREKGFQTNQLRRDLEAAKERVVKVNRIAAEATARAEATATAAAEATRQAAAAQAEATTKLANIQSREALLASQRVGLEAAKTAFATEKAELEAAQIKLANAKQAVTVREAAVQTAQEAAQRKEVGAEAQLEFAKKTLAAAIAKEISAKQAVTFQQAAVKSKNQELKEIREKLSQARSKIEALGKLESKIQGLEVQLKTYNQNKQELAGLRKEKAEILEEIEKVKNQIKSNTNQQPIASSIEKQGLKQEINFLLTELTKLGRERQGVNAEIKSLKDGLARKAELEKEKDELEKIVRDLESQLEEFKGKKKSQEDLCLASLNQLITTYRSVATLRENVSKVTMKGNQIFMKEFQEINTALNSIGQKKYFIKLLNKKTTYNINNLGNGLSLCNTITTNKNAILGFEDRLVNLYENMTGSVRVYVRIRGLVPALDCKEIEQNNNIPNKNLSNVLTNTNIIKFKYNNKFYEKITGKVEEIVIDVKNESYKEGSTNINSSDYYEYSKDVKFTNVCKNSNLEYKNFFGVFPPKFNNNNVYTGFIKLQSHLPDVPPPVSPHRGLYGAINQVLSGYSVILFGYGLSGSGKTHTLFGNTNEGGILQESVSKMLESKAKINLIYAFEQELDSFSLSGTNINLKPKIVFYPKSLTPTNQTIFYANQPFTSPDNNQKINIEINNIDSLNKIISKITDYRKTSKTIKFTLNNNESSRSHLYLVFKVNDGYLTFVDMGGREDPFNMFDQFFTYSATTTVKKDIKIREFMIDKSHQSLKLMDEPYQRVINSGTVNRITESNKKMNQNFLTYLQRTMQEGMYINETINQLKFFLNKRRNPQETVPEVVNFTSYSPDKYIYTPETDKTFTQDILNWLTWFGGIEILPSHSSLMGSQTTTYSENPNKPAKFVMICCVRPGKQYCEQTKETLDFAASIKSS